MLVALGWLFLGATSAQASDLDPDLKRAFDELAPPGGAAWRSAGESFLGSTGAFR